VLIQTLGALGEHWSSKWEYDFDSEEFWLMHRDNSSRSQRKLFNNY